jgi:hypothetical protein
MSESPRPQDLRHVEEVAALGYLLNAIAHDLNNLLTNLMLGADQVQYGDSKDALELMLEQVQRISGITRVIQRMGQRNMMANEEVLPLHEVAEAFAAWHRSVAPDDVVELDLVSGAHARLNARHMVHALSLLALGSQGPSHRPLSVTLSIEERPRSAWSGSTETVSMGVLRLRRGEVPAGESTDFKRLVDGFFEAERSPSEIATMAAWEVIRKVRGRMRMHGDPGGPGVQVTLELPLAEAP